MTRCKLHMVDTKNCCEDSSLRASARRDRTVLRPVWHIDCSGKDACGKQPCRSVVMPAVPLRSLVGVDKRIRYEAETLNIRGGSGGDAAQAARPTGLSATTPSASLRLGVQGAWHRVGQPAAWRGHSQAHLNFGHFDVWEYGSNFINIDALFSDGRDPANELHRPGATEVYGVYRGQFSPDKIFGLNTKIGPIEAINFEIGGDFNTKNTQFAPEKRLLVVGPNFHLARASRVPGCRRPFVA